MFSSNNSILKKICALAANLKQSFDEDNQQTDLETRKLFVESTLSSISSTFYEQIFHTKFWERVKYTN